MPKRSLKSRERLPFSHLPAASFCVGKLKNGPYEEEPSFLFKKILFGNFENRAFYTDLKNVNMPY
jgi:hypothetical protein